MNKRFIILCISLVCISILIHLLVDKNTLNELSNFVIEQIGEFSYNKLTQP